MRFPALPPAVLGPVLASAAKAAEVATRQRIAGDITKGEILR